MNITLDEAYEIHKGYWALYSGVKRWEQELLRQWSLNGGWVLNGIGRPIGVADGYERDLVNRVCQSTGHGLHMWYVQHVAALLREAAIEWKGIIIDWHDAMTIEVSERDADAALRIMQVEAYARLNAQANGLIPLRGEAKIVHNLAESKCE